LAKKARLKAKNKHFALAKKLAFGDLTKGGLLAYIRCIEKT
jgi:hypothetical protein